MSLTFFIFQNFYFTLDFFFKKVNKHAKFKNCVIMLFCIKINADNLSRKTWIICDRDRKIRVSKNQEQRHSSSRSIENFFFIIAIVVNSKAVNFWIMKIINVKHIHCVSAFEAHSIFKKLAMISIVKDEMSRQLTIQIVFFKVLKAMWIDDSLTVNVIFILRDVYNFQVKICREKLEPLTSIQTLIREFDERNWIYELQKKWFQSDHTFLFHQIEFSGILKKIHEVLIMNIIYKTNWFKISLLIIYEQTALHINFYVAFCFISQKKTQDHLLFKFLSISSIHCYKLSILKLCD